jgi:protein involved in polysaccharide export with SLBB domain
MQVRLVWLGLFLWGACLSPVSALTPTPQQLQMFNGLSAAEKQQVLNLMGQGGAGFAAKSTKKVQDEIREQVSDASTRESDAAESSQIDESRLKGGDTLILHFIARSNLTDEHAAALDNGFKPKQVKELYTLDKNGVLATPYTHPIVLGGLNEEQAANRLSLVALFSNYLLTVSKLPLLPQGQEGLQAFGYELFRRDRLSVQNDEIRLAVPNDYSIGPGDVIHIQLYGKDNQFYELEVSREGSLLFPGVGAISVAGFSFSELKRNLIQRVKKQFIGVEAQVSMGALRTMHVLVTGEVEQPGTHYVGALSSITQALSVAGGISDIGSLRNVKLKRNGKVFRTLDLYDLLIDGDTSDDLRLLAGDVVHVSPLKRVVAVSGEVRRPAFYELKSTESIADVLALAGGVSANALMSSVRAERITQGELRQVLNLDAEASRRTKARDGDYIRLNTITSRLHQFVTLSGAVERPGKFQWREGLRIHDLLDGLAELDPQTELDYALLKRHVTEQNQVKVLHVDLRAIFNNVDGSENVTLQPRDELLIFSRDVDRQFDVQPLVAELQRQATVTHPAQVVRVQGQVHSAGSYPLTAGMRVSDLITAAGYLKDSAYTLEAELTHYEIVEGLGRQIQHRKVDLNAVLQGDQTQNVALLPYDLLTIKEVPLWLESDHVELLGEVRFPGKYAIARGEKLSDLIRRAGGFTEYSYVRGAVFMREELRQREQKQLDAMAANLEAELAAVALQRSGDVGQVSTAGMGNDLLGKLRTVKAAGRLVVHLDSMAVAIEMNKPVNADADIVLQGGDKLFIPGKMQEVTVLGEVFHPTSHLFSSHGDVEDYLDASGGMTNKADKDNVYVIKANGSVKLAKRSWMNPQSAIEAGDTIIVPFDSDKVSSLKLWTDVSQIVYQLGVSVAAWNSVSGI